MKENPVDGGMDERGVLCGTDFSKPAEMAASVAAKLARAWGRPLELLHVGDEAGAGSRLQEAAAHHPAGTATTQVRIGKPAVQLVKHADARACRLLVVGAPKQRTGHVAEEVAALAEVPTLIIREETAFSEWIAGNRPLRVFVAYNFTETADAALQWAGTLEALGPCEITVCFVDWLPEQLERLGISSPGGLVGNPATVQQALEAEVRERATAILGHGDMQVMVEANWGRPDAPLAGLALERRADLLVTGCHHYSGFERFWHTSISRGLLQSAAMSVAVVPRAGARHRQPAIPPRVRRVLVSTDFSTLANSAIRRAYSLVGPGDAVAIVHVIHPEQLPRGEFLQGLPDRRFAARHGREIRTCTRKLGALVPVDAAEKGITTTLEVVEHGSPAHGICEAAVKFGADVICMGTHGRSGLSGAILGSVAQDVLAHAGDRPVLLVRESHPFAP